LARPRDRRARHLRDDRPAGPRRDVGGLRAGAGSARGAARTARERMAGIHGRAVRAAARAPLLRHLRAARTADGGVHRPPARAAGLPVARHWLVYLPALAGSFLLMLPAVLGVERPGAVKAVLLAAIAVLLAAQAALPQLTASAWSLGAFLLVFFTAFNVLEAH